MNGSQKLVYSYTITEALPNANCQLPIGFVYVISTLTDLRSARANRQSGIGIRK
jgi:hypothetical protein